MVLGLDRDLLERLGVSLDLRDELVVARLLLLLAGADQLMGEERQHHDDQKREPGALEEPSQFESLLRVVHVGGSAPTTTEIQRNRVNPAFTQAFRH